MPVRDDLGTRITTSAAQYLQPQIMNNLIDIAVKFWTKITIFYLVNFII